MKIFDGLFKGKKKKKQRMKAAAIMELYKKRPPPVPELSGVAEKEGWVSPLYTRSRAVALDPKLVLANRCVGYVCGSYEAESYKVLRTHILQKTGEHGGTTVMITSALPGEGKTLTSINLALTFSKEFKQTVLLVDSDLRQQRVHEYLGYRSDKGLRDYLVDGTPLPELIVWPGVDPRFGLGYCGALGTRPAA